MAPVNCDTNALQTGTVLIVVKQTCASCKVRDSTLLNRALAKIKSEIVLVLSLLRFSLAPLLKVFGEYPRGVSS